MHSGKNFSAVHFLFWCRQASDHRFRTGNAEKTPILAVNTVYRKSVYSLLLRFHRERISRTFPLAVFEIKFFILLDFPIFPKLFYINRRQNASSSRSTFGTKNAPIFHTPAAKGKTAGKTAKSISFHSKNSVYDPVKAVCKSCTILCASLVQSSSPCAYPSRQFYAILDLFFNEKLSCR